MPNWEATQTTRLLDDEAEADEDANLDVYGVDELKADEDSYVDDKGGGGRRTRRRRG